MIVKAFVANPENPNEEINLQVDGFTPHGSKETIKVHRAEVSTVIDETQIKVIVLDADDSFDVAIQDHLGEREIIWSVVKDPE